MLKRIFGYCVMVLFGASSAVAGRLAVDLRVDNGNVLVSEPVAVQVSLRNPGADPVSIAPLEAAGDHPNVVFEVVADAETHRVEKPVLVLEQAEGNRRHKVITLHSGQTMTEHFVLGIDWASEKPIFQSGTNWLVCTVITSSGENVQSEKTRVVVSPPTNEEEVEIQRLLADMETLRSMYATDYVLLVKQPEKVVASMRRIASLHHAIAQRARMALSDWKKYEQEAREGRAPGLKAKGFDRLGLQHVDKREIQGDSRDRH